MDIQTLKKNIDDGLYLPVGYPPPDAYPHYTVPLTATKEKVEELRQKADAEYKERIARNKEWIQQEERRIASFHQDCLRAVGLEDHPMATDIIHYANAISIYYAGYEASEQSQQREMAGVMEDLAKIIFATKKSA